MRLYRTEDEARAELEQEGREAERIREWWATPRFAAIRRPYTAEQVIALRGTSSLFAQKALNMQGTAQPTLYPYSAAISKKCFNVLDGHQKNGTASVTFGSLDPIQVANMAQYLDTVYVSGWQCSSTAASSNEPGPDLADYPYDTVPKKVLLSSLICFESCKRSTLLHLYTSVSTVYNSIYSRAPASQTAKRTLTFGIRRVDVVFIGLGTINRCTL